jgi:UDP-N-acetylglucosamine--N-acetylmuramyl-(pentapeptide) pyrophosphoryl-undecaprenol N-acetylglucosamine transferase
VLGGSQGAHSINEAMVAAVEELGPLRNTLHIIHQTGESDRVRVEQAYAECRVSAEVTAFIDDMVGAYKQADVVVSRAGAITVTELLICGKPAILIPYPHAAHNHQEMNARMAVDKGAACMILDSELTGTKLGRTIRGLYERAEHLGDMEVSAYALSRPKAAREIVTRLTRKKRSG